MKLCSIAGGGEQAIWPPALIEDSEVEYRLPVKRHSQVTVILLEECYA
jgi:hypothetical protein